MDPKDRSSIERDAKGASVNLLTLVAQASLPAFHVQLARVLGATGYGLYSWSSGFVDMFSVLTLLGMDVALSKQVSVAHAANDENTAARATGTALRSVLFSGALVAVCLFFGAPSIAHWQNKPGLIAPLRFLVLVPIAYHVATVLLTATQAKLIMRYDFWARGIVQPLLLLLLTTVATRTGWGVAGAAGAVAAGMTLVAVLAGFLYSREFSWPRTLEATLRGPLDWNLLRDALPLVAINIVGALQGRIDALALGHYRPASEVGAYGACTIYVASLVQIRSVFYPLVAATLPPAIARGDWQTVREILRRQTRWIAMLAMPLCVLFAGFGDGLLAIFGSEFLLGRQALGWLALGYLSSAHVLSSYVLAFSGRARYTIVSCVSCVVVELVLLPLLIPRWGLTGAAISATSGLFVSNGLQIFFTWRTTGVHAFSYDWLKVPLAAVVGFLAGRALFVWLPCGLAAKFFAGSGLAGLSYLLLLLALRLDEQEEQLVRRAFAGLRRRLRQALRAV